MEFSEAAPILHAIAMAEASDEPLDLASTAADLEITEAVLRQQVEQIEDFGLALSGLEEGLHPILLNAGRQYLALAGEVDVAVLSFLPSVIDDLHARRALLQGGTVLVDEFRAALLTSVRPSSSTRASSQARSSRSHAVADRSSRMRANG